MQYGIEVIPYVKSVEKGKSADAVIVDVSGNTTDKEHLQGK